MKTKYFIIGGSVLIIIAALFFIFKSGGETYKVIKSLNAQNYDMAISKLKEMIYDDETDYDAKGLLLYAQTRKYYEENKINDFKRAMRVSFSNLLSIKKLIYQMRLSENDLLSSDEREAYLKNSKDLRKQLVEYSIPTEDMSEITNLLKSACETGVENLKLAQGDEVDQALYAFLLAGDSFFGSKESAEKLIKIAKMNEDAQPLFLLCGSNISELLKKEIENDESLVGEYAKYIFIKAAMKEQVAELFNKHSKMRSAYRELKEKYPEQYNRIVTRSITFPDKEIFFEEAIFEDFLKYSEVNKNIGIDISVYPYDDIHIVSAFLFDPGSKNYISKFYCLVDNELKEISFDHKFIEFSSAEYPITFFDYEKEGQVLKLAGHRSVKKTGYKTEQRYNPQKYYSSYSGYSGAYEYVSVPYEYEDIDNDIKSYTLNKDKAQLIPETKSDGELSPDNALGISNSQDLQAVIDDPDGYTNIRSGPGNDYSIVSKVVADEIFSVVSREGSWWRIKTQNGNIGYIHNSRIRMRN